ncbi:MAG: pyruvate dehydrogenase (acetyl-transferring) E1 component subunit alpha [Cyanobacteria bacterium SZAS-4]|nr:pyruvate dehydrogenase (acetyl-transferring) E1 component subunit alpha [Cyanobacteria bacterium SZAS-4]
MPRKPIDLPFKLEYLSVLDENAELDKKLEPKLTDDELKTLYRYMLKARRADERMLNMQRQGRIGTFPQASGHEAISMGSIFCLEKEDWLVPAYRELAGMLYRGWPLETILLYWNGFEEGAKVPDGINDLPMCVPVASQLLHAAGIGMAMNIQQEKKVVLTFFGDGSSSEGDCHEALNFAAVFNAPVVFICLNNQYAISVPIAKQMKNETVAQRAIAYGMQGIRVDGNDVLAVYTATQEAIARARKGEGPTLIECLTYRFTPHTTADDPKRYRSEDESKKWHLREPLLRFAKFLKNKGIMNDEQKIAIDAEIDAEIKAAVAKAEELAKSEELMDPLRMFDYSFADMPPFLAEQRQELADHIAKHKKHKKEAGEKKAPSPAQI